MCLKNLWNFTRMCIERTDSIPLPSYIFVAFTHPSVTRCILEKGDIAAHVIRRSLGALVVNKLTADINAAPTLPINDADSSCLSAILGIDSHDVTHWLNNPGAIYFANTVFLILDNISDDDSWSKTPDVLDVIRQTFSLLSEDLPAQLGADIRLDLKDTLMEVTKCGFEIIPLSRLNHSLNMHTRDDFSFPRSAQQSYRHVSEELMGFHKNVH
jgi:hypothetical protein